MVLVALLVRGPAAANCDDVNATLAAVRGIEGAPIPAGREVAVAGVVGGRFAEGLDGFFLQSTPPTGREPVGVFVYTPEHPAARLPARGDRVRIAARTGRYQGRVQLEWVRRIESCGDGDVRLHPTPLAWPAPERALERLAGVLVRITSSLVVTDNYHLARYGSLGLSAGGRRSHAAGASARILILDDGSYGRAPRPVPFLTPAGTRRLGSRAPSLTGVLTHAFGAWRLHPVAEVRFEPSNPRPLPPPRQGVWRVVSFNLENYFVTLGGRGANDAAEFARQRRRLAVAIRALDADVLALQEVENTPRAVASLLAAVNRGLPSAKRYEAVAAHRDRGEAVLRNVLLYRPAALKVEGVWIGEAGVHDRAPVSASFAPVSGGAPFGIVVVHFKSKAGCPESQSGSRSGPGDVDRGAGCWSGRRQAQAQALIEWLPRLQARAGHDAFLIAGDLNAYARQPAARWLRDQGLIDLIAHGVPPARRYTYVYYGRAGYLDHALATPALARRQAETAIWHINADEPPFAGATAPARTPWRVSDHDPVIIDLGVPGSARPWRADGH